MTHQIALANSTPAASWPGTFIRTKAFRLAGDGPAPVTWLGFHQIWTARVTANNSGLHHPVAGTESHDQRANASYHLEKRWQSATSAEGPLTATITRNAQTREDLAPSNTCLGTLQQSRNPPQHVRMLGRREAKCGFFNRDHATRAFSYSNHGGEWPPHILKGNTSKAHHPSNRPF